MFPVENTMHSRFLVLLAALLLWAGLAVAKINVNNASLEELDALPGIGQARAQAIIKHREQNGPFRSGRDLKKVEGLPASVVDKLRGEIAYSTAARAPASEPKKPAAKKPPVAVSAAAEQPAAGETRQRQPAPARPAMPGTPVREAPPEKAVTSAEATPVAAPAANHPPAPARPAMPGKLSAEPRTPAAPAVPEVKPAAVPAKPAAPAMPRPAQPAASN
jgi:competence protein ComEA